MVVEDAKVLDAEEGVVGLVVEDVVVEVSVLTTVVVCVVVPVEDSGTVNVWVMTVVTTSVGFITHLYMLDSEFQKFERELTQPQHICSSVCNIQVPD